MDDLSVSAVPVRMKAVAKTGPVPGAEVIELDVPRPMPDEVLVRITTCAICGTDVHRYQWNESARSGPGGSGPFPRILGHEFCGTVAALGERVDNLQIGDRITAETHRPCGKCWQCRNGYSFNCGQLRGFRGGIFAQYAVIPASLAVKVPACITDEAAATLEPFGVAVHAMECADVAGDCVLVTGAGPIGIYAVKLARAFGASTVIASDISAYRREMAAAAGADILIDPSHDDIIAASRNERGGVGTVFECSGNTAAIVSALDAMRKCGTMLMMGLPSDKLELDVGKHIVYKAARIIGVYGRSIFRSWDTALSLLSSGRAEIDSVITHRLSLFGDYEEGFSRAERGEAGKVVFHLTD